MTSGKLFFGLTSEKDRCGVKKWRSSSNLRYCEREQAWFTHVHMGKILKTLLHIVSQMFSFGSAFIQLLPLTDFARLMSLNLIERWWFCLEDSLFLSVSFWRLKVVSSLFVSVDMKIKKEINYANFNPDGVSRILKLKGGHFSSWRGWELKCF